MRGGATGVGQLANHTLFVKYGDKPAERAGATYLARGRLSFLQQEVADRKSVHATRIEGSEGIPRRTDDRLAVNVEAGI